MQIIALRAAAFLSASTLLMCYASFTHQSDPKVSWQFSLWFLSTPLVTIHDPKLTRRASLHFCVLSKCSVSCSRGLRSIERMHIKCFKGLLRCVYPTSATFHDPEVTRRTYNTISTCSLSVCASLEMCHLYTAKWLLRVQQCCWRASVLLL